MNLQIERWESSEQRKEIHFFILGDMKEYVLGFNPEHFPEEDVKAFLEAHGYEYD